MKSIIRILSITLLLSGCSNKELDGGEWKIIYKNDKQGKALIGSKLNVVNAIRNGADLKIGWGNEGKNHTIEHLSVHTWLAIMDGKEVTARLDPHISATVDWENLTSNFSDASKLPVEWRVIINTKGEFDAIWYDRKNDTLVMRRPQRHSMTWFSKTQPKKAKPLFSNVP